MNKYLLYFFLLFIQNSFAQNIGGAKKPYIKFLENKNQWQKNILFKADVPSGNLYLEPNSFTFDFSNPDDVANIEYLKQNQIKIDPQDVIINKHAYKIWFQNANTSPQIRKENPSPEYYNYFIGKDSSKWASKVKGYETIIYNNLYDGINLKIYSTDYNLKYDFSIAAGINPAQIKLNYEGLDNMYLANGNLYLKASFTELEELKPSAYQIINNRKVYVACNFILQDKTISFNFPSGYNTAYELIIDPELIFGSYSGSSQDNWGYTATYDAEGNLYGGGIVFGSGYPTTTGAYQISFGGGDGYPGFPPYSNGCDIGISKFSPDGTSLLYATYLGGNGNELPHSLIVNSEGSLLIYGTTSSDDFPTTAGCYDNTFGGGADITVTEVVVFSAGTDIIVSKLNADGTNLQASTYIGGSANDGFNTSGSTQYNYGDHARGEIQVDASDNVYVASSTFSSDFPVTAGAYQTSIGGGQDGCVLKLNSNLSSLLWSTYLGGGSADGAYSIKLNSSGNIIVCGGTASSDFPVTAGSWMDTYQGSVDGWVAKLNASGTSLLAGTFAGTNQYDQAYFIETDAEDNIYITGQTKGSYPVTAGVYSNANGKQFITKLNSALTSPVYSTVFGSGGTAVNISPAAFLVDVCENVYVSGWGGFINESFNPATGTTSGMPTTADALDASSDGNDFYFFVLEKNGASQLYGSYFGGGTSEDHVDGGTSRFDKSGTIYQGVCAGCGGYDDFPTTPTAWSTTNGSYNCNLGVGKIKLDLAGVYAISEAEPSINGCVPFTVDFTNLSSDAEEYIWNFGDASPESNLFEPSHTYTTPGTYNVSLIVIDSSTCNIRDTSYLTIVVLNDSINANFNYAENQNCDSLIATFTDMSLVFPSTTYAWNFGDGSTSTAINPVHTYSTPGTYTVQLIINDSTSCNYKDTATVTINYLFNFNTGYDLTAEGCLPLNATFTSNFTSADSYIWNFGDGTTSTEQNPIHTYTDTGSYFISLTIIYCGITDVYTDVINVEGYPTAYFDAEPSLGIINTAVTFINECTGAISYDWEFSDGSSSNDLNATHTFTSLGNHETCLTATNASGCSATYCRTINIEAEGAADIPTGFSPNGDGENDILFVRGFGISELDLKIFNRWGELVFETHDQKIGWDGTLRSKPQDMEVYVYTLAVTFLDGKTLEKQGNITLLR